MLSAVMMALLTCTTVSAVQRGTCGADQPSDTAIRIQQGSAETCNRCSEDQSDDHICQSCAARDLSPPGELTSQQTLPFEFNSVEMEHDSYRGLQVRLRCVTRFHRMIARHSTPSRRMHKLPNVTETGTRLPTFFSVKYF